MLIKIAPNGAVTMIAITEVDNIACPYPMYVSFTDYSTPVNSVALSRIMPPIAACTVAFGIHPNAINSLS